MFYVMVCFDKKGIQLTNWQLNEKNVKIYRRYSLKRRQVMLEFRSKSNDLKHPQTTLNREQVECMYGKCGTRNMAWYGTANVHSSVTLISLITACLKIASLATLSGSLTNQLSEEIYCTNTHSQYQAHFSNRKSEENRSLSI